MSQAKTIELYEGNARVVTFLLRIKGTRTVWDVSGASSIVFEVEKQDGTELDPIACASDHADADWANGIVAVVFDTDNVTAEVGTYRGVLTITTGAEIITVPDAELLVEVLERPGYTPA